VLSTQCVPTLRPRASGPHKTIYNRFIRWSRPGVFNRIFAELPAKGGKPDRLMVDPPHLKAHRTAASLLKKGLFPDVSAGPAENTARSGASAPRSTTTADPSTQRHL